MAEVSRVEKPGGGGARARPLGPGQLVGFAERTERRHRSLGASVDHAADIWCTGVPLRFGLVIGLLVAACGGSTPTSSPGSSAPSVPTTSSASASGAVAPCLIGSWIDRGESDTQSYRGTSVVMNGLVGKTIVISQEGGETIGLAHATPLQGQVDGSSYVITEIGTITDRVSTRGGVLSFSDVNYTSYSATASFGGASAFPPQPPPPLPERYSCGATTLTLSGSGVHATFTRSTSSAPASSSTSSSLTVPAPSTSASRVTPDLFVSTAAIPPPGELFVWPNFPTTIARDDNDWMAGITWSAGLQSASGSGTLFTDLSCSGSAAACPPTAEGTVEFSATLPETCIVTFVNPSTGVQESERAHVYGHLQYTEERGPQPGQVVVLPSPCE